MNEWIEIDNFFKGTKVHRNNKTIIIEQGKSITMLVYSSDNDAIFASLGIFSFFNDRHFDSFVDE